MKQNVVLLNLVFILFSLFYCSRQDEAEKEETKIEKNIPRIVSNEFYQIFYNKEGEKELIVYGSEEKYYQDKNEMLLNDIRALILNKEEDGTINEVVIEADKGRLDLNTRNGEVWGNVVIIRENEVRIETEKLTWNNSLKKLYSKENEEVTIYRNDGTVTKGKSLVAEDDLNIIELEKAEIIKSNQETKNKNE